MTSGQLKGTLLEYIVRRLMLNCGFSSVIPDGHYIFQQAGAGLYFINGKGAAHDADVLMDPPIQMPFSYPSRLLFECKSNEKTIGLGVIRNALGLRYDINDFEIVTDATITQRRNNLRANYAIANRKRFHYQVAVASVEDFSKPAFEFAANNKITLLSMRWFLETSTCDLFHNINTSYLSSLPTDIRNSLYAYLKDKSVNAEKNLNYHNLLDFLKDDTLVGRILSDFNKVIDNCVIGLLETGDLLFLFSNETRITDFFRERPYSENIEARLYYNREEPTKWTLAINNYERRNFGSSTFELKFNVPTSILSQWRQYNYDRREGYNLKGRFFSKIFIFSQRVNNYGLPFTVVYLDSEWLAGLQSIEEDV